MDSAINVLRGFNKSIMLLYHKKRVVDSRPQTLLNGIFI